MPITLTTDFGHQDPFVGIMKGVIVSINPNAQIVDLTHGIPVQDVMAAALTLRHAIGYFPRGTIHVAVVDPGVGSNRKPLLIENDGNYFLGPDNGIFSLVVGTSIPSTIVELANPAYHLQPTSNTFHGRDVFAPAAAHLSLGISPEGFGPRRNSFVQLAMPRITRRDGEIDGEIIYVDGFGNLFTNVEEHDLTGLPTARLAIALPSIEVRGLATSYAMVRAGDFVAVINSWGLLEVSVYKGSAQRLLSAKIGDRVHVRWDG